MAARGTMTPNELELARSLINVSGQGYDVLVSGTVLSGIIDGLTILSSVLVGLIAAKIAWDRVDSDRATAAAGTFIVVWLIALIIVALLGSAIMSIIAPDYTAVTKILSTFGGN